MPYTGEINEFQKLDARLNRVQLGLGSLLANQNRTSLEEFIDLQEYLRYTAFPSRAGKTRVRQVLQYLAETAIQDYVATFESEFLPPGNDTIKPFPKVSARI